jgi:lipid-binding SYLF domain-containing protein
MKKNSFKALLIIVLMSFSMSISAQVGGWKPDLVEDSEKTLAGMIEKQPKLQSYKDKAYGYAVFPKITKGAVGIGGAGGKGVVFKNHEPTGQSSMSQATIGFQLGGQQYKEVIFFENFPTRPRPPSTSTPLHSLLAWRCIKATSARACSSS